jgi:hypothetical protein
LLYVVLLQSCPTFFASRQNDDMVASFEYPQTLDGSQPDSLEVKIWTSVTRIPKEQTHPLATKQRKTPPTRSHDSKPAPSPRGSHRSISKGAPTLAQPGRQVRNTARPRVSQDSPARLCVDQSGSSKLTSPAVLPRLGRRTTAATTAMTRVSQDSPVGLCVDQLGSPKLTSPAVLRRLGRRMLAGSIKPPLSLGSSQGRSGGLTIRVKRCDDDPGRHVKCAL